MKKSIQEDGTSCISFRPSILDVACHCQIADTSKFGTNYLLIQSPNVYGPLIKVVEHRQHFKLR
jgi:hypothetical protein